jgi:RNA polymerase sigma factor (sigma-70 family)
MRMRIRGAIYDEMRSCNWLPRKKKTGVEAPAAPAASIVHLEDLPAGTDTAGPETDRPNNPFEALDAKRTAQSLNQALDAVSSRDRLVLHLHYFRGMPVREIGRLLGVSDARVSQIHHRALERIRLVLATA